MVCLLFVVVGDAFSLRDLPQLEAFAKKQAHAVASLSQVGRVHRADAPQPSQRPVSSTPPRAGSVASSGPPTSPTLCRMCSSNTWT